MNLVRLGHYFTPSGGSDNEGLAHGGCRTALVVHVNSDTNVNLAVWNSGGGQEIRTSVIVAAPTEQGESFHLSLDCPWDR
jgi:hypothetical protein